MPAPHSPQAQEWEKLREEDCPEKAKASSVSKGRKANRLFLRSVHARAHTHI